MEDGCYVGTPGGRMKTVEGDGKILDLGHRPSYYGHRCVENSLGVCWHRQDEVATIRHQ